MDGFRMDEVGGCAGARCLFPRQWVGNALKHILRYRVASIPLELSTSSLLSLSLVRTLPKLDRTNVQPLWLHIVQPVDVAVTTTNTCTKARFKQIGGGVGATLFITLLVHMAGAGRRRARGAEGGFWWAR